MSPKSDKSRIKSDILLRVRLLYVLFIATGALIIVRLVWVQFASAEVAHNAHRLEGRIFTEEIVPARRGRILASNGDPLATSIIHYRVDFDFGSEGLDSLRIFDEQSDSLAGLLADYFGDRPAAEYRRILRTEHDRHYKVTFRKDTMVHRSEGRFARWWDRLLDREMVPKKLYDTLRDHTPVEILPREVDYTEWQTLRKFPLLNRNMGIVYRLVESDERIYPQGALARRTIGLTGDRGNYGIEHVYREELAGKPGKTTRQRIARGFSGRVADKDNVEPVDGMDIVTTLDVDMQAMADECLRRQMTAQNAIWGTTIVMEVETGEIVALVNLGRTQSGGYAERENYALGRSVEPGSTFKLATMLLLLEDAKMPLSQQYDTGNGRVVEVGGIEVRDSHGGHTFMDFRTAVAQSSNVYFAEAVWRRYADRKERVSDFLKGLHLDRTVGLEAFGERTPQFHEWNEVPDPNGMLVRRSFGYRIKFTPIQIATLYNAVANGGRMISPVLVKELRRGEEVVGRFESETLVEKIASEQTLRQVRSLLETVGVEGTGAAFFGDTTLYRVAAKTGTAQYADERISYRDGYYVGTMAAYFPAHKPRYTVLTTIFTKQQTGKAYYGGPLSGPVVRDVIRYLYNKHSWAEHASRGPRTQHPVHVKVGSVQVAEGVMPDVAGMGLKEALFLLESRGLRVSFSGAGAVREQSIPAGTEIRPGETVELILQ